MLRGENHGSTETRNKDFVATDACIEVVACNGRPHR
jgi:hypothetical protein